MILYINNKYNQLTFYAILLYAFRINNIPYFFHEF